MEQLVQPFKICEIWKWPTILLFPLTSLSNKPVNNCCSFPDYCNYFCSLSSKELLPSPAILFFFALRGEKVDKWWVPGAGDGSSGTAVLLLLCWGRWRSKEDRQMVVWMRRRHLCRNNAMKMLGKRLFLLWAMVKQNSHRETILVEVSKLFQGQPPVHVSLVYLGSYKVMCNYDQMGFFCINKTSW